MNKKFLRYSVIAAAITYSALFLNINYGTKYNKKIDDREEKINKVSASMIGLNKESNSSILAMEGAYFTPCLNYQGTKFIYSSGDDIYEMDLLKNNAKQLTIMGNCYNPVYYEKDNNLIAFARSNGIFIIDVNKKEIKRLVGSDNPEISYAKPNFTPEGDIIYFKIRVIPKQDGHGFIEQEPGIYKISKDGKTNVKIMDGYNPVLSKDGKKLLYELDEKIYVMDMKNKKSTPIDTGKYASWANSGKSISYAKFENEASPYTKSKTVKNLFIDKEYSNIFIANLDNLKDKIKLTKEEFENRDKEIEDWAKDIKNVNEEQHFLVVSKMAYFDSFWSKDDKELYVSVYNADKGDFQLFKYKINK